MNGKVYAADFVQAADGRLTSAISPANTSRMLQVVRSLEVVEHGLSRNYCTHLQRDAAQCVAERTIGLVAQQVATVEPRAVSAGTSLKLVTHDAKTLADAKPAAAHAAGHAAGHAMGRAAGRSMPTVLENVEDVQSIRMSVLVAQLVGAVQAQASQIEALQAKVAAMENRRN